MLDAVPRGWLSWNYDFLDGGRPIASFRFAWIREAARLEVRGESYEAYREGFIGDFVLASGKADLSRGCPTDRSSR